MVKLTALLLLLILGVPDVPAKLVDYSFQLVSSENGRVSSLSADVNEGLLVVSATNDGENIYGTLAYDEIYLNINVNVYIYRTMAIACMNMGFGTALESYPVSKSNFFGLGTEIKFNDIASFPYFSRCFGMVSTWDSCLFLSLDQDVNLMGLKCLPKIGPEVYNSLSITVDVPSNVVISGLFPAFSLDTPSKDFTMLYIMDSRYAPQDLCEMKGLKSLFTVQIAHELFSKDRIYSEDLVQAFASLPVLSSKDHKYSWDTSDRSRLSLEDPWTPNDLPPYLGNGLVAAVYFCQNQSLVFGPYNSNKQIVNCTDPNTVIEIHSAMSGGVDKTETISDLCSGASMCQTDLYNLSIEYSCTSNYSYEFSLDSDTYPVPEAFGFASHWIKDKTIGHGLLKLDVHFKGKIVKSGFVKFSYYLRKSSRFFCGMLGYTESLSCEDINSTPDIESVMNFNIDRSGEGDEEHFYLHYSEENATNDTEIILLTCGPDDNFWSDNLTMVVNETTNYLSLALDAEDQLFTIALPSEYDDYEDEYYLDVYYPKISQHIQTMGNTICQEMGFREAFNVSITNTTLPDNTCIYLGPKEFSYMEDSFAELMTSLQGIGVDAKNWKVLVREMIYTGFSCKNVSVISLECSPEVLPVGEIVLSVFAADFYFIDDSYDSFLLIGSHISDDGVKFRGPVCESPEITHTIAEGVCQRAGFKQAWQVFTPASFLDDEEILLSYRTSAYYQMGSGLMEVHDLKGGNFTKNTCDLGEVAIVSCIGTYESYRLTYFFTESYYEIPEYKVKGRPALICKDSQYDVEFLDNFCVESFSSDYQSNNTFSHLELIEMFNLRNSNQSSVQQKLQIMENLESGLYVQCGSNIEGKCEWQVKNCSTFLAVHCVEVDQDEDEIEVTESSTFLYIFANLENLVADLKSNFGTIAASVREYSNFTGVESVSLPYMIISTLSFNESTVTKACRSGGFLDYENLSYIKGCSSCWPHRLNDREVILFSYPNDLYRWSMLNSYDFHPYFDFDNSYQSRVTCQGSRLVLLNSDDKVSQGYPVILDYDSSGLVRTASTVLITNFDQADGLCRTFRGNGAFWFSKPETFDSSLLDGAGILSSSVLNGEFHCGICSESPENFGDCSFSTVSSTEPKGVFLECLEPEDEELNEDLASTLLNFDRSVFSVIISASEYELCVEHGIALDGIKWLLSWFDVDLTTINSFILHPSTNITNGFGVFCQETQMNNTHCAFNSISECNGWTIEVLLDQPVENIELVDGILYVTDQGPVCADNFTDQLAASFCWVFGYNKGGFSSTQLVNDSSVTINCSNDSCQFVTDTCLTGAIVRLDCEDKNVISYIFMEGYDETPRGASGVLGVLWNESDQPRVLYVSPPAADGNMTGYSDGNFTNSIAGIFCEALRYSTGGTIRESPDDITDEDEILLLRLDCPISFSDRYCPSIETVTGDELNWYSPVILTCEYPTSDIRFTWEKTDSEIGQANMILRAQYGIIYLNGSVLEVSGAVELSDKTKKDLLCRTAGASAYDDYYSTRGTVVASDFQCLTDPIENMTTDCKYEVNYNFAGYDPDSYLNIRCQNESAVFWINQLPGLDLTGSSCWLCRSKPNSGRRAVHISCQTERFRIDGGDFILMIDYGT
uniref:Putative secretory peptide-63 n=1 Tax=Pleurobrachia bachei TaxID=34499 RepID=M4H1S2_PLEBA|nr:putative secretory peptide-63 [Pleurobrachia bachei]|eukprot:sb/3460778/